ncbi:Gag protein, partial [Danaus plexippus plexippus]
GKFFRARGGTSDSDESGSETVTSLRSEEDDGIERRRFRKRRGSEEIGTGSDKGAAKPTKRGRGRPPTTGQYVGLHQAQKEKLAEERRVQRLAEQAEADRQIAEMTRELPELRSHRLSVTPQPDMTMETEEDEVSAAAIGKSIAKSLEVITNVASKSKNLSGPFIKALKLATKEIQESTAALLSRTKSTETRALEAANARLSKELAELRAELAAVRREVRRTSPEVARVAPPINIEEVMERAVREAVTLSSARLNARLESLESRLLPAPRLRPPLASDGKETAAQGTQPAVPRPRQKTPAPEAAVATLSPPTNPGPEERKRRRIRATAAAKEATAARKDGGHKEPTSEKAPAASKWTKVPSKKEAKGKNKQQRAAPAKKKEEKRRNLRAPKSAAVVITLQPGATDRGVSYKDVLERAKKSVDLAAFEIPAVRFRVAATGARMLEVSGSACKERANALAGKLVEVLGEDVRISRPQKCAELRVSGLDDSASASEIAEAIARSSNCAPEEVKIGEIRRNRGRGTAWVKCPVEAAKRATTKGARTYVGWTVVRVALLEARQMRCFKCQEVGHTRATCSSEVDRSESCFRCGQPGHTSAQCENAPHCVLCAEKNKPANHSVGSKACGRPTPRQKTPKAPKKKAPQKPAAIPPTAASTAGEVPMEASQ